MTSPSPLARLRRLVDEQRAAALPGLLLAGIVGLVAVLAYQAQDAARSNVRRAEATLRDYSAFAGAEYARQVEVNAGAVLRLSFEPVVFWLNNAKEPRPEVTAAHVAMAMARRRMSIDTYVCDCLDSLRYAFRVTIADSAVQTAPIAAGAAPSAVVERWLRDTVLRHIARLPGPAPMTMQTYGATDPTSEQFGVMITNDSYVTVIGEAEGRPRLLAYVLARDIDGHPLAAYGYEAEPRSWLLPLLRRGIDSTQLLPQALLRGLRNDQVVAVSLRDGHGHELYRSSPRFDDRYAAADTLAPGAAELRVSLAVFPELADRLLVGGLPRSRLPLLLALSALAIGLACVALLQVRRQQELARLRTDFVSGVSHELRTPLAQIRWFAELLRMGRLRSAEERDRSLRIIDQEARRLAFLVENVLNFSRSGRDAGRVKPEPAALAHEVREVVDSFLPLTEARRMRVALEAEEVTALVDRAALRQVLLNLLDNAVKYGPPGQTIRVRVGRGGIGARLVVEDAGPGVPEGERDRVWEPFYRAGRDVVSAVTGSGIGLSVVSDLVLLQQGRRWVERGDAGGARFVVEFPALAADDDGDAGPALRDLHSDEYPVGATPHRDG